MKNSIVSTKISILPLPIYSFLSLLFLFPLLCALGDHGVVNDAQVVGGKVFLCEEWEERICAGHVMPEQELLKNN